MRVGNLTMLWLFILMHSAAAYDSREEAEAACGADNVSPLIACSDGSCFYSCWDLPKGNTPPEATAAPANPPKIESGPATRAAEEILGPLPKEETPKPSRPPQNPFRKADTEKQKKGNPFRSDRGDATTAKNPFRTSGMNSGKIESKQDKKPVKPSNPSQCISYKSWNTAKATSRWKHFRIENVCHGPVTFEYKHCGSWGPGNKECDIETATLRAGGYIQNTYFDEEPKPYNIR